MKIIREEALRQISIIARNEAMFNCGASDSIGKKTSRELVEEIMDSHDELEAENKALVAERSNMTKTHAENLGRNRIRIEEQSKSIAESNCLNLEIATKLKEYESRSCAGCKHYAQEQSVCYENDFYDIDSDFSCSEWEAKDA